MLKFSECCLNRSEKYNLFQAFRWWGGEETKICIFSSLLDGGGSDVSKNGSQCFIEISKHRETIEITQLVALCFQSFLGLNNRMKHTTLLFDIP